MADKLTTSDPDASAVDAGLLTPRQVAAGEDAPHKAGAEPVAGDVDDTTAGPTGESTEPPLAADTAYWLDQEDHDDVPMPPSGIAKKDARAWNQTEPPGVIAGETAAMMAPKYVEGVHRHDEECGWEHAGPIVVDGKRV